MDQCVIRSLKAYYKALSVRKLINAIEKNESLTELSILDALRMLDVAWKKITTEAVGNCFVKAGISKEKQAEALIYSDDPFQDLQDQLDKFNDLAPEFFPEGTTANDIVSADDSIIGTERTMTDDEIVFDALNQENAVTEEDTDCDAYNEPACPQSSDVRQALDVLRDYMLFSDGRECIQKCVNQISAVVENELTVRLRQADIRNFF